MARIGLVLLSLLCIGCQRESTVARVTEPSAKPIGSQALPIAISPGDVITFHYGSFSKPETELVVEVKGNWISVQDAEKKYVPRWINANQLNYFFKRVP